MKTNRFQKVTALILALAMAMCLAACGGGTNDDTPSGTSNDTPSSSQQGSEQGGEQGDDQQGDDQSDDDSTATLTNAVPALSKTYANSAKVKHESITLCANGDPGNLLPQDTQNSGKEILDTIFERLYVIDGFGGELLPDIAEDQPVDNGDGTVDIKIRENVYDSDGNHITASDVAYSYTWLVTNSTPQNMGKFQSAEAISDYVVRFHCEDLDGVSDYGNLFAQQWIFSEKAMGDHDFASDPVGSGPYKLTKFVSGSEVVLEARDDYWAEGQDYQIARMCANVQTIRYVIMGEASQQANALRTGEVDFSNSVPETDLPDFINDGEYASSYVAYPYQENLTVYLAPNCDSVSQCSDENLRKAIMYAIDGTTAAIASGNSTAQSVYDLYNSKFPEYRDSWYTEDNFYTNPSVEKAKEYLAQSNYDGSKLVLVTTDAPPFMQNVGNVIATLLQSVGIDVDFQVLAGSIATSTLADPANWDINLSMMAADDYGVVDVARLMDKGSYGGGQETVNFIVDDELQRLVSLCNTREGHTDENTQALHEYIIEHAYARGLFCTTTYNIVTSDIQELAMSFKFLPMPGGCIYTDNEF